jgi:rhodanese-related sulfurtransferase
VDEHEIDVDGLEMAMRDGACVIDVRQPDEYHEVHAVGVKLIPMDELPEAVDDLPTDTPVYVICATGARSERAAQWLLGQGYDAFNVVGGTSAWVEAGKPVATGAEPG